HQNNEESRKHGNRKIKDQYSAPATDATSHAVEVSSGRLSYRQEEETSRYKSETTIDSVPIVQAAHKGMRMMLELITLVHVVLLPCCKSKVMLKNVSLEIVR